MMMNNEVNQLLKMYWEKCGVTIDSMLPELEIEVMAPAPAPPPMPATPHPKLPLDRRQYDIMLRGKQ